MRALLALNLRATIDVHPLVAAQVGELRIGLAADLAPERLDTGMDVLVLLEATRGGKGLSALATGVAAGADVLRPDVAL